MSLADHVCCLFVERGIERSADGAASPLEARVHNRKAAVETGGRVRAQLAVLGILQHDLMKDGPPCRWRVRRLVVRRLVVR